MVLVTALTGIAERVGANRIFKAEGRFHHPLGDPTLSAEAETAWRYELVRAAARMLTMSVGAPTIKDARELAAR